MPYRDDDEDDRDDPQSADMDDDDTADDSDESACPLCGATMAFDAIKCPQCGSWVNAVNPAKRRIEQFIWSAVTLIIAAALIYVWVLR
ncbi:hypothetical protein RAS2_23580 [Phycisphaerae bacterium RAS2]|nr:hypothetical protein RAS2_23580 [Phycisphaerae bacterium RAS2]